MHAGDFCVSPAGDNETVLTGLMQSRQTTLDGAGRIADKSNKIIVGDFLFETQTSQ